MKKTVLPLCVFAVLFLFRHTATAQTWPLDPSFGINGISLLDSVDAFVAVDMSLQDDGKILITVNGNCNHGFLCRLLPNGTLDPSFTPSPSYRTYPVYHPGVIEMQGSACNINMTVVRQLSSKKVLWVLGPGAVFQYNADGTTDSTFGFNGAVSVGNSSPNSIHNVFDVREQVGTGVVFASGTFPPPASDSVALARMQYNGMLDPAFGINGSLRVALPVNKVGPYSSIMCMKILPDMRVLVAGNCITPGSATGTDIFLALYKANGTLDATFGNGGVKLVDYNHATDDVYSIAYRDDNNIYLMGSSGSNRIIFKTNITGAIDNSYGNAGVVTIPYGSYNGNMYYKGAVTPDNILFAAADSGAAQLFNYHAYTGTGSANTQLTPSGIYASGTADRIGCMLSQPDNKMLVFGTNALHPRLMRFDTKNKSGIDATLQNNDIAAWVYNGQCYVNFVRPEQAFTMTLLGIDGKQLGSWQTKDFTNAGDHRYVITLPAPLPHGIYLLRIDSRQGSKTVKAVL